MDDLKALAAQTMAGLEEVDDLSPAAGFEKMVRMGLIDRQGRLARRIGVKLSPHKSADRRRSSPRRRAAKS